MVYLRESRLVSLRGLYLHLTLQPQKRKLTLKQVTAIYIKSLIAGCIKLIKISYGAGALTDVGPQFLRLLSNGEPITSWVKDRSVTYLSSVDNNSFIIGSILKSNIVLSKYSHDFSQLTHFPTFFFSLFFFFPILRMFFNCVVLLGGASRAFGGRFHDSSALCEFTVGQLLD